MFYASTFFFFYFSYIRCYLWSYSFAGKLTALDEKWIQVVFEPPELKVGGLEFTYGGESEVKLEITYVDEKIRLGKGSRGSLFVFQRRQPSSWFLHHFLLYDKVNNNYTPVVSYAWKCNLAHCWKFILENAAQGLSD